MKIKINIIYKIAWVLLCCILELLVALFLFSVVVIVTATFIKIAFKTQVAEGGLFTVAISTIAGFISVPFSLIPSYFLSLKLAKWLEKKWGVKIESPGRLFLFSLFLPVAALILLSLLFK